MSLKRTPLLSTFEYQWKLYFNGYSLGLPLQFLLIFTLLHICLRLSFSFNGQSLPFFYRVLSRTVNVSVYTLYRILRTFCCSPKHTDVVYNVRYSSFSTRIFTSVLDLVLPRNPGFSNRVRTSFLSLCWSSGLSGHPKQDR